MEVNIKSKYEIGDKVIESRDVHDKFAKVRKIISFCPKVYLDVNREYKIVNHYEVEQIGERIIYDLSEEDLISVDKYHKIQKIIKEEK